MKNLKRVLSLTLIALLALSCFSASAFAADDDPYADLGNYTMTVGHAQPAGNPRTVSMEKFAEDVYERTNGHVEVTVFDNGQLGTEKEMLEQTVAGIIQGMRGGQFDFTPRLMMFSLPFLTQTREEVTALLQSDLAKSVSMETEKDGVIVINLCDAGGYRQFSNNDHVIKTPEDLKGLKIRTNGMATSILTFETLGANTVTIPYADLYMSLKTGVADGQDNPFVNVEGMKFYEVQKYFTETNYQFHPDPFYVNADWWNSLPEEFQTILLECAEEMGNYNDQLCDENADAAKQAILDSGSEIYVPTADELAQFSAASEDIYQKAIEQGICTQEELDEMKAIVAEVRGE